MSQKDSAFSTQNISPQLVSQVIDAIKNKAYGSVEIYISNYTVTQITERVINKVVGPKKFKSAPMATDKRLTDTVQ